jgi:hypothetical protein
LTAGKEIEQIGGQGDALYAIRGSVPETFRMIKIKHIRYLGKMSDADKPKFKIDLFAPLVPEKPILIPISMGEEE